MLTPALDYEPGFHLGSHKQSGCCFTDWGLTEPLGANKNSIEIIGIIGHLCQGYSSMI